MMNVIAPLGIESEAAQLPGTNHPRIVQVAFGNENQVPSKLGLQFVDFRRQLFKHVQGRQVDDRMNGIQP